MSQAEKEKLDKNVNVEAPEAPEAPEPPEAPEAPEAPDAPEAPEAAVEWENAVEEAAEKVEVTVSEEERLQQEVAILKDQLLRKEADFQNYRKRMAREVSDARRVGLVETVTPFLQLFDLFDMAMKAADKSDNVAALKQGLEMILNEYGKAIDELGVQKFDAVGTVFDPLWHDAVGYENSEDVAEGVITKQWNCGYKLGDKLLRPARVIVSSGAAVEDVSEEENTQEASR